jgi:hypothetical protein
VSAFGVHVIDLDQVRANAAEIFDRLKLPLLVKLKAAPLADDALSRVCPENHTYSI